MLVLSLGFNFVSLFLAHYFHMDFTPSLIGTLLATNVQESQEFLKGMVLPRIGIILGYLAICVGFLNLVRFKLHLNMPRQLKTLTGLVAIFWAHTLWVFFMQGGGGHGRLINLNIVKRVIPVVKEIYAVCVSLKEFGQIQAMYQGLKQLYPKDYLSVEKNSVDNVVLIVGESASKNFMGLYGYDVPNTPFLSVLKERERERDRKIYSFLMM
ncbi:sulfatase-like hydrolase/transferase [Helicobacter cynogastricus]|uniref:sulfatase-like hydrolase/transferase n=1 Tax=Helicobacter cynogastricus TaxID=329937 RepID=UPI001F18D39D|nr:sulfatase-like hydrolase/transferase [Helicobacter cynogastricus]